MALKVYGITDRGRVRSHNEDSFSTLCPEEGVLAILCDGMGGARSGDVASSLGVESFLSVWRKKEEGQEVREVFYDALHAANEAVLQRSLTDPACAGMGTTLVCVWLETGRHAYVLNVGDSRAYHIRPSGIQRITRDHSLVEDLVAQGKITPEQARLHPNKNIITRALGTELHTQGDLFELDLEPDDYILLCSDGLSNLLTDQEILYEVLHGGTEETCCRRMIEIALERGAPDNVTVILIHVSDEDHHRGKDGLD